MESQMKSMNPSKLKKTLKWKETYLERKRFVTRELMKFQVKKIQKYHSVQKTLFQLANN